MAFVTVLLSACGRLGFDASDSNRGDGDGGVDAPIDTPVGQACTTDLECGRCARCDGTCSVEPVNALFLGHRSTCYLGTGGTRWCAGNNTGGQLGLGDQDGMTNRSSPERADDGGGWEQIYLYYYSPAIGIRAGQEYRWGNAGSLVPVASGPSHPVRAALGDLTFKNWWELDGTSPIDPTGSVWRSLSFGADHSCGVKTDGTLHCWGTNRSGSLGQAGLIEGAVVANPAPVGAATDWDTVAVGGDLDKGFSCAIKQDGFVYCWGHPWFTGTNGLDIGAVPSRINGDLPYAWLQANWERACAGTAAGNVRCWGHDSYGGFVALGLTEAAVPTSIPGTYSTWILGGHHACGLTMDAAPRWRCFGWNTAGQLGIGTTINDGALYDLCP